MEIRLTTYNIKSSGKLCDIVSIESDYSGRWGIDVASRATRPGAQPRQGKVAVGVMPAPTKALASRMEPQMGIGATKAQDMAIALAHARALPV